MFIFFLPLLALTGRQAAAQCTASQGTITVSLDEADTGTFLYTWRIQNSDGGVGNRLENVYFEIATATSSNPSTLVSTWGTSTESLTTFSGSPANWTALRFTYSSGPQIYNGAEETFSYSLDQFVNSIRVRTRQKNGQTEDFADFTSAGSCSLLPVELVSFDARVDGASVSLYWATATEENAAGFEVQYRRTAEYETIGYVDAHGTSDRLRRYRYEHLTQGAVLGSFRLKMIDLDGTFQYSPEVKVAGNLPEGIFMSHGYPNPFNPTTQLEIAVDRRQRVSVDVFDVTGARVASLLDAELDARIPHSILFAAGSLPSGLYIVRAVGESFSASRIVTLLK